MTACSHSVLITQGRDKTRRLREPLETAGILVRSIPLIEIKELQVPEFGKALADLDSFDWLLFTSANAVRITAARACVLNNWPPATVRIGVVGPGTAKSLQKKGARPDLVAGKHQAEGLYEGLRSRGCSLEGSRILLPLARIARPWLVRTLTQAGAIVSAPLVYDTVPAEAERDSLNQLLRNDPPDVITLASSSAAHSLVALAESPSLLKSLAIAAIGPVTALTVRDLGLDLKVVASEASFSQLAAAVERYLDRLPS